MSKDKRPIRAVRSGSALWPAGQADFAAFAAIKEGEPVEITIKQRRSLPQLQAYWAMLSRVVEATEIHPSAEHLHEAIKMALGYITPVVALPGPRTAGGSIIYVPDSVAFNKMTAPEFREYFKKAEKLIAETLGIDPSSLHKDAA